MKNALFLMLLYLGIASGSTMVEGTFSSKVLMKEVRYTAKSVTGVHE